MAWGIHGRERASLCTLIVLPHSPIPVAQQLQTVTFVPLAEAAGNCINGGEWKVRKLSCYPAILSKSARRGTCKPWFVGLR